MDTIGFSVHGIMTIGLHIVLEWDKLKITSDKPSYSQFNPVWIFPPFLDEEIRQQMHHCGKFLDLVWFHFLNAWK